MAAGWRAEDKDKNPLVHPPPVCLHDEVSTRTVLLFVLSTQAAAFWNYLF
jgi:hypothetical protein